MPNFESVIASPTAAYDEGLAFFRGQGMLNHALGRISADLERSGIAYAVIGAIALNQHGYQRFTVDIDLLMTKEGLQRFRDHLVGQGYLPAFPGATWEFKTSQDNIRVVVKFRVGKRPQWPAGTFLPGSRESRFGRSAAAALLARVEAGKGRAYPRPQPRVFP